MKKIPTLFTRGEDFLVTNNVHPGLEYVLEGKARATEKFDGTSCLVSGSTMYKRYTIKWNRKAPEGFVVTGDPDPRTGKQPGWVPVGQGPEDQWHWEAWRVRPPSRDGTYELVGPRVQGNPYGLRVHELWLHGQTDLYLVGPADFDRLRAFLAPLPMEGIVWWNDEEPVAKLKRSDFGFPWPSVQLSMSTSSPAPVPRMYQADGTDPCSKNSGRR